MLSVDASTGTRSYTVNAYLEPNLDRPNLMVLTEAQVTRIILETDGAVHRATGVEFIYNNKLLTVNDVKRDVILCAGA